MALANGLQVCVSEANSTHVGATCLRIDTSIVPRPANSQTNPDLFTLGPQVIQVSIHFTNETVRTFSTLFTMTRAADRSSNLTPTDIVTNEPLLRYSLYSNRSTAHPLEGATLSQNGTYFIFLDDSFARSVKGPLVEQVSFQYGSPLKRRVEENLPWDLLGDNGQLSPLDVTVLFTETVPMGGATSVHTTLSPNGDTVRPLITHSAQHRSSSTHVT